MKLSHRVGLTTLARALLRCWIIGFAMLLFWFGALQLMGAQIYNLHASLFGLSEHELRLLLYGGMGLWKMAVLTLFFVPWLSLKLVLRSSDDPRDPNSP